MKKCLVFVLIIFAMGCAKKQVAKPDDSMMTKPGVTADEGMREVQVEEKILPRDTEQVSVSSADESVFEFKDALFNYDRYDIRPDARAVLDSIAGWLTNNKNINVLIEGHCDERGTNEYNLALGEKRATSAKNYLIARGVTSSRISTISYGEEKPACTESNEVCWQKNRRAHFNVTK